MKLAHFAKLAALTLATSVSGLALAQDTQATTQTAEITYTPEQTAILQDCDFASWGFAQIAGMQQQGMTKEKTQEELNSFVEDMVNNTQEDYKVYARGIGDLWKNGVDGIYNLEIGQTDEEKFQIIESVYINNLQACVAELSQVRNVPFN